MAFEFTRGGVTYQVRTHVGDGNAVVDVKEVQQPQPTNNDSSEVPE